MALLQWASRLRWLPGQGHVTYMELAQDFEAHAEQALRAPSDHRLRGVTLPLRTRGEVLKMALDALQPHLQARDLLHGKGVCMDGQIPLAAGGLQVCWRGRCAHCSRARTPCCSKCASWRRTAARYGRGAWRDREQGSRMCSCWTPGTTRAAAPTALSALAAPAGAARPARGRKRGPGRAAPPPRVALAHDTGPRSVPPVCSGAPSTAASGLTKNTAWTRRKRAWRHKRCGCGCSPRSRPGPAPWRRPRPRGARQARTNAPARNLPHQGA